MSALRKQYSPEKKMEILPEHLKYKVPVSELCEKYGIHPNIFHKWEKQLFEGGVGIFSQNHAQNGAAKESSMIKKLKENVHRKEGVIGWLTEENIKLKKTPGDL